MRVRLCSEEELEAFLTLHQPRHFFHQTLEYAHTKRCENTPVSLFLFEEEGAPCGSAVVVLFQYKRLFYRAHCLYGPLLLDPSPTRLQEAAQLLQKKLFASFRIRKFLITPAQRVTWGSDLLTPDPEPHVQCAASESSGSLLPAYHQALESIGFSRIPKDWFQNPILPVRILYTKPLEENWEQTWTSLTSKLRNHMSKAARLGVQVRPLTREELPLFDTMLENTYDRKETCVTVRPEFHRHLFDSFGSNLQVLLAYAQRSELLASCDAEEKRITDEIAELDAKIAADPDSERKYTGPRKTLVIAQQSQHSLRKRIEMLRPEAGEFLPLNAGLFLRSGTELINLLGAGYADSLFLNGAPAIHHYMLQQAQKWGCKQYNIFGCSGIPDKQNTVDAGVQEFKRTFNGQFEELVGTYSIQKRLAF